MSFDIAVIGAGLIGSSCAKYCSILGAKTVLIGPDDEDTSGLGAAWIDEGRITRVFDSSPIWMELAKKSIENYRNIEEESGVEFFTENGYLFITKGEEKASELAEKIRSQGFECTQVDKKQFPEVQFPAQSFGYRQPDHSGHISPRNLVRAQRIVGKKYGCTAIAQPVVSLTSENDGTFRVNLSNGNVVKALKVVISCGSYANFLDTSKIKANLKALDLTIKSQTVTYVEIPEGILEKLDNLPSMVTDFEAHGLDSAYILPPIKYPDGKVYMKIGHGSVFERHLETYEDVQNWYQNRQQDEEARKVEALQEYLHDLIPVLKSSSLEGTGGGCVTVNTPGKLAPYIDELPHPNLFVAVGGCGYAAKSSDYIGKIAANLAFNKLWISSLPQDAFKAKFK